MDSEQPGKVDNPPTKEPVSPEWAKNRRHTTLVSDLEIAVALELSGKVLHSEGWTVGPANRRDNGGDNDPGTFSISAIKTVSRAAQLHPLDEEARLLLGMWSLKDKYPRGVARGGCMLATYEYSLVVQVAPSQEEDSLSRIDVWCQEVIAPYRAQVPDATRFYIPTEIDSADPTSKLTEKYEAFRG